MVTVADGEGTFGRLLQRHRRAAGLSQQELAERAGLSLRGIADLERGARRTPYPATVRLLAEALGLGEAERAALTAAARPGSASDLAPARQPAGALPLPLTSFVGRQREQAELIRLLSTTRLLTLVGPGGIGKTRLALEVARAQPDAGIDGVALVELAAVAEDGLVVQAMAGALGVTERPGQPLETTLAEHLRARRLLLVLDNCEHVLGACAVLVQTVLQSCPEVRVLATSREPLGVPGEVAWRVPALAAPGPNAPTSPDALMAFEAIVLFVDRARVARTDFALDVRNASAAAEVCRRLDGLPLALELAAARTTHLSVEQIAARLDDRFRLLTDGSRTAPPRHQTLRAAIEWSHGLLTESERILFRRLGVFAGGCSIEGVEQVCAGDGLDADASLDALARLVAGSLVVADVGGPEARYVLLETVRAYALERLATAGETDALRARHLTYYLTLAEDAEAHLTGPDQVAWLDRLQAEQDNLWAALEWGVGRGDGEAGLRLAGALQFFWHLRGSFGEGARWLRRALDRGTQAAPTVRAKGLWALGLMSVFLGNVDEGLPALQESLGLAQAAGDLRGTARALSWLGQLAGFGGQTETARTLLPQAVAAAAAAGDTWCQADALGALGWLETIWGRPAVAEGSLDEALTVSRRTGDRQGERFALGGLSLLALRRGGLDQAEAHGQACLDILATLGGTYSAATQVAILAEVGCARGQWDAAERLADEALTLGREAGSPMALIAPLEAQALVAVARDDLDAAAVALEEAVDAARRGGPALVPWTLARLADVESARGQAERAARLLAEARAAAEAVDDRGAAARVAAGLGRLALLQGRRAEAGQLLREALSTQHANGLWPDLAESLEALADVVKEDEPAQAARLLAAACAVRMELGLVLSPTAAGRQADRLAHLQERLGRAAFEAAWADGTRQSRAAAAASAADAPAAHTTRAAPSQDEWDEPRALAAASTD